VADLSKLVKELSGLTVLDAVELTEALADKWGVNHGQKATKPALAQRQSPTRPPI
jgi:ribosomal protein L7/L12